MTTPDTPSTPDDPADARPPLALAAPTSPLTRFVDAVADTLGAAFGIVLGAGAALAVLVTLIAAILSGAAADLVDQNQYQDRLDAIDAVYRQGVKSREALARTGITVPTDAACETAFRQSGAYKERDMVADTRVVEGEDGMEPDTAFAELRRLAFINGCRGRPNTLPPVPLPGETLAPTASPPGGSGGGGS